MKKYARVFAEFERGARRHRGEDPQPGEPDCMYWVKHHEAALIVVTLLAGSRRADLPSSIQQWYRDAAAKIAAQWNKYERHERKIAGTGNSVSPDAPAEPKAKQ